MQKYYIGQTKAVHHGFFSQSALPIHDNKSTWIIELLLKEHVDLAVGKWSRVIFAKDIVLELEMWEDNIIQDSTLAARHAAFVTNSKTEHAVAFNNIEDDFRHITHHGLALLVRDLVSVN
jgi:hypothetical protein